MIFLLAYLDTWPIYSHLLGCRPTSISQAAGGSPITVYSYQPCL